MSPKKPKTTNPPAEEDFSFAPDNAGAGDKTTGRVKFDDRGNAVWEWSVSTGAFARDVSTDRLQKLESNALSLADDAPTPVEGVRANPQGTKKGYDPYDSGKLAKAAAASRKKDLRKLGEWLKLKKQAATNKKGDDET
ncbi:MAG TPA: hypothetical protein VHV81_15005 [Steroidobacteraceae bacterium]|nr:hypothetical protein [Steroidobacteraceae bacterium]